MGKKSHIVVSVVTVLVKGAALFTFLLWVFPLWNIDIPLWLLIIIAAAFLTYEIITFRLGGRALAKRPVIWSQAIVGCRGKATIPLTPDGYVKVKGELWRAYSYYRSIQKGDDIVVVELDRLTLRVTRLKKSSEFGLR